MVSTTLFSFLILCGASAILTHHEASSTITFKTKFLIFSYISSAYPVFVGASPKLEEAAKLKKKIKIGTQLLEDFNVILDRLKEDLSNNKPIDKELLDELMQIKDKFTNLKVDPTDLSKDLLESFRDRTLEAFGLILKGMNINVGSIPELEMLKKGSFEAKPYDDEL